MVMRSVVSPYHSVILNAGGVKLNELANPSDFGIVYISKQNLASSRPLLVTCTVKRSWNGNFVNRSGHPRLSHTPLK